MQKYKDLLENNCKPSKVFETGSKRAVFTVSLIVEIGVFNLAILKLPHSKSKDLN
jgi:hypothetical protein